MITKGKIVSLNTLNSSYYKVYIPLFQKSNESKENAILKATCVGISGIENSLKINDTVIIGFEDNKGQKPIILGKLFTGHEDAAEITTTLTTKSLTVTENTNLGLNTNINNVDVTERALKAEKHSNEINTNTNDINEIYSKVSDIEESGGSSAAVIDLEKSYNTPEDLVTDLKNGIVEPATIFNLFDETFGVKRNRFIIKAGDINIEFRLVTANTNDEVLLFIAYYDNYMYDGNLYKLYLQLDRTEILKSKCVQVDDFN